LDAEEADLGLKAAAHELGAVIMLQARVASHAFLEVTERLMEGTARLIPCAELWKRERVQLSPL